MATQYYDKSYEEVRKLPWQEAINYYANNPSLYDQEMKRIDSVLSQQPDHIAGYKWKDQVRTAREQAMAQQASQYGKYDLSTPAVATTITPKYENQISNLLSQIQNMVTNQQNIDVTRDPRYQAQQKLMERNVQNAQRQTMEQMNARGLLMSDMTNDRLGQIEQAGMDNLNAYIPQLYSLISGENQQQLSNMMGLLSTYQQAEQMNFQNELALRQQTFNEALQQRNYNLAVDQWVFNKDLSLQQLGLQREAYALESALSRVNTLGRVTTEADAKLLGVPVGTLSDAAFQAAENRKLQLQMHNASLRAQEKAEKSATINQLLALWQATGTAPPGLEEFGIKAGQEWNRTPKEKLEEMLITQEVANLQKEQEMQKELPNIQKQFGVDQNTASAIYKVWENPTYDAAMADFNTNIKAMKDMGINTSKVKEAIEIKWNVNKDKKPGGSSILADLLGGSLLQNGLSVNEIQGAPISSYNRNFWYSLLGRD